MSKEQKKLVTEITSMEEDFAQWYTDVVKKADLADYSTVGGCIIFRPYGYAIWELIQGYMDAEFKKTGHENVYMPLLIPESLLEKEKDHVEGFAPEVAWVTHGGSERLEERLCIRPTSETLFCDHYSKIVQSYRDLPKLYNQWCSVLRWEKTTRPFLRTREFLWQEGHTIHATEEDAQFETLQMLDIYADVCERCLAMPVVKGQKTDKERFAGAKATYTIESMMHDGKALQSGTSHNFGDGFARVFDIKFTDQNNTLQYVHQTSWGASTRLIGGIIMSHSDNSGLVLPPKIAPIQVILVPISIKDEKLVSTCNDIKARLIDKTRVKVDLQDKSAGWKFSEYEMKGVPVRIEVGQRDLESGSVTLARRDTGEKVVVSLDNIETEVIKLLDAIQQNLYDRAKHRLETRTFVAKTMDEMNDQLDKECGFIKAMWCGSEDCEMEIKDVAGATSRCIPFKQEVVGDTCVCCGKKADKMVIWGRAY